MGNNEYFILTRFLFEQFQWPKYAYFFLLSFWFHFSTDCDSAHTENNLNIPCEKGQILVTI